MTVSSRREREQKMRREMILDAAHRLFKEKGYEASTVDEIAALAELGKGTIYSYFKSKDEIYLAILEKGLESLQEQMELATHNPESAVTALYQLFAIFIQYHHERSELAESFYMQVDPQISNRLRALVKGLKNKAVQWTELVSRVLTLGVERGELAPCEVDKTAKVIVGVVLGMILQLEMGQITNDLRDYRAPLFKVILEGLVKR